MTNPDISSPQHIQDETDPVHEGESKAALHRILSVSLEAVSLANKLDLILDILFDISWLHIERKGAVFLADNNTGCLTMVSSRFLSPELCNLCSKVPYGYCMCGKAAETKTMVFSDHLDHNHDVTFDGITDHGHYCQPIMSKGLLLGVLTLYVVPGHIDRQDERYFLQSVADTLAGIIERERVEEERQRLVTVIEDSPDFIGITDTNCRPIYFNRSLRELLDCKDDPEAIAACRMDDMFADQSARLVREEGIPTALAQGVWKGESSIRRADGSELPVSQIILAPHDKDHQPHFLANVCRDISDRKKVEETLQALALHEKDFANAVIDSLPGIFFTLTESGHLARWNENLERNLGYSSERLAKMSLLDLVDEVDAARLEQAVEQSNEGRTVTLEVRLHSVGGMSVSYLVSTTVINSRYGRGMAVVGVGFDISDRKALEKELEQQASIDFLTGAYNRRKLMTFLNFECARVRRYDRPLSLFMFDIDHFKRVNDTHGHDIGDRVLCEVVRRAQECLRKSDIFARWGGEEFVVLVSESSADQAAQLAEKIRATLKKAPIDIAGMVTASFGVVEYRGSESAEEMIVRADRALYRAKSGGRDRVEIGGNDA